MRHLLRSLSKFMMRHGLVSLSAGCLLFLAESGCRVQAGNPQTNKPVNPGTVTVALADAPVDDLAQLFIRVYAVAFAPEGTGRCLKDPRHGCADSSLLFYELGQDAEIDLLSLSDGRTQVLPFSQSLPAGVYEGLRLLLAEDSHIEGVLKANGQRVPVAFQQSPFGRREFTIAEEFEVQEGTDNEILIHVDLRRSLRRLPDGSFTLSPFTHVVPTRLAAQLYGVVGDSNVTRLCAYPVGGRRRPDKPPRLMGERGEGGRPSKRQDFLGIFSRSDNGFERGRRGGGLDDTLNQGEPDAYPENAGQPDATSSCDNAEAVSEIKDGRYELRFLPPVTYLLRLFKSDGTFTDTRVEKRLFPQEKRELNL